MTKIKICNMTDIELRDAYFASEAAGDADRSAAIWAVFVARHSPDQQPINCHPEYYGGWYALRGEYDLDVRVAHADSEVEAILWLLDLEADDALPVDYGMAEERARYP